MISKIKVKKKTNTKIITSNLDVGVTKIVMVVRLKPQIIRHA